MALGCLFAPLVCALAFENPVAIVIEPDPGIARTPEAESISQRSTPIIEQRQTEVVAKLRIQRALRDARSALRQGRFADSAAALEPFLDQAQGSEQVLETLEAAYRGRLQELLEKQDAEQARLVAEKLRALNPAADSTPAATRQAAAPVAIGNRRNAPADVESPDSKPIPVAASPKFVARARIDHDDVPIGRETPAAHSENAAASSLKRCRHLLSQAETCYKNRQYREALEKYELAYDADPVECQPVREHWGYCVLWCAVERYNSYVEPAGQVISEDKWRKIEEDCRLARQLAPSLDFADTVLASVARCRELQSRTESAVPVSHRNVVESPDAADDAIQLVSNSVRGTEGRSPVRRRSQAGNGWELAETENFRIFHRQPEDVERIARMAELARLQAHEKWFAGETLEPWSPKCDLTVYPSAQEYQSATGVGIQSPGHSKTLNDRGRVTVRQLFIRSDDPNMMNAVLPHEVAHVVFAGKFGHHAVPRWADEGMAVLTEPMDKQEAHLRNLGDLVRSGRRFSCNQLLTADSYPPGSQMRDFYAQSVGVCRHLVEQGGERKLVQFIRTALQSGDYDGALRQVYGTAGMRQLEAEFDRYASSLAGWSNIASR